MRRRSFLASLASLAAAPVAARAQDLKRTWRIGYLSLASARQESSRIWLAAFEEGLRQLGYVEGANLVIERRFAAGRIEQLPALATQLIDLKVDLLVTAPAGSALAAKSVTSSVPIVFMAEPDPVAIGLVASLGRPGGNVTGLADAHGDLIPKRLEFLKAVIPTSSRVGVLWNSANPSTAPQLQSTEDAARKLGLDLSRVEMKGPSSSDLDQAFAAVRNSRIAGLLIISDTTLGNHRSRIAELSIQHRLATSGTHRAWAEAGLLMSYGSEFIDMFRRGATFVDKILKGTKPADLPVEQPIKFELLINLRTAKTLGLAIPASLMTRADKVLK